MSAGPPMLARPGAFSRRFPAINPANQNTDRGAMFDAWGVRTGESISGCHPKASDCPTRANLVASADFVADRRGPRTGPPSLRGGLTARPLRVIGTRTGTRMLARSFTASNLRECGQRHRCSAGADSLSAHFWFRFGSLLARFWLAFDSDLSHLEIEKWSAG